jgi:uncharacterized protein (TIGR04255 family)
MTKSPRPMSDDSSLPSFEFPPVVEVALGVQFAPLARVLPIDLGDLTASWRTDFPIVQEQLPLAPAVEAAVAGDRPFQFVLGPGPQSRFWFLSEDQHDLIQLQRDRLVVNWRGLEEGSIYPRYKHVRDLFARASADLERFLVERKEGPLNVVQAEVNYINAIDPRDPPGDPHFLLSWWKPMARHHLASPNQTDFTLMFDVDDLGAPPVRMYVDLHPAQRDDGRPVTFLTLTVRGAPAEGTMAASLAFMDGARSHIVRSFDEMTTDEMHEVWVKQR